jgi:formylglycine-generating enzyme required for sulfatase activity
MEHAVLMRLALVTALWLATGCYSTPDLGSGPFRCDKDLRCPEGQSCVDGVCTAHGFVHLAAARFTRGCDLGPDCPVDAQPARTISLGAFLLQDHEVTQREYNDCASDGRCGLPLAQLYHPDTEPDLPVRGVSRDNAEAYCQFLGGRLPTEAEWERAAREHAGPYPWGTLEPSCQLANYVGCSGTVALQSTAGSTPSGLHDLAGNVREWVSDRYAPDYYATSTADTNPTGPDSGEDAVVRGGGFESPSAALRVWARDQVPRTAAPEDVGVRCARAAD